MHVSRFSSSFAAFTLSAVVVAACSAAPGEGAEQLGQADSTTVCASMPTCSAIQHTWDDVAGPWYGISDNGVKQAAVEAEMIAVGCTAPKIYKPCAPGAECAPGEGIPISICPVGVSADVDAIGGLGWCDACTGQPAAGQRVVTWKDGPESPGGCEGSGCSPLATCTPAPNTCKTSGGPQCGVVNLGCGATANCGICPGGRTCVENQCPALIVPKCTNKACQCTNGGGIWNGSTCS